MKISIILDLYKLPDWSIIKTTQNDYVLLENKGPMQSRKILRTAPTQIYNWKHNGDEHKKIYLLQVPLIILKSIHIC
jgi:hypothetical protein